MSKQPDTFTKKVPNGNAEGKLFCKNLDARNLEILPKNPPEPIRSSDLIISNWKTITLIQCTLQSNIKKSNTQRRFANY